MTARSRIMGIDPGSRATGYGIIDQVGSNLGFVTCGTIRTENGDSINNRLLVIYEGLRSVIERYNPDVAAIEDVFLSQNARSALKLGHARGVAVLAAMKSGLQVHDYSPRSVKQAVAGYGQADKYQVQHMVKALLELSSSPSNDAADALAVAICHANQAVYLENS
ncbi:MAG: crossover junction endodeoxyribonuclease RuvC [Desulfobulbaceae bacterium]|nr:crossover junction endodeoxyribonuclease RuvC [Desulfobulbaceae bacterium]